MSKVSDQESKFQKVDPIITHFSDGSFWSYVSFLYVEQAENNLFISKNGEDNPIKIYVPFLKHVKTETQCDSNTTI